MILKSIQKFLSGVYRPEEYPALAAQFQDWRVRRPLEGIRILDGTPVFRNTTVKYCALLAAGADLAFATSDRIPNDPETVSFLEKIGLPRVHNRTGEEFDVILDCGGVFADQSPRCGFVELTRSGLYRFEHTAHPVILVDDSRIKAIETCLGTGDGFLRGLRKLGYDLNGRTLMVFGYGKVGRGVAYYAHESGATVFAVDRPGVAMPDYVSPISLSDKPELLKRVRTADFIVSATGIRSALADPDLTAILKNGSQTVVNMGVEDEFGPGLPAERVLNRKQPLNFILEEPTRICYIDPTMALHNAAAVELLTRKIPVGISKPDPRLETLYWNAVEEHGIIADELKGAGL